MAYLLLCLLTRVAASAEPPPSPPTQAVLRVSLPDQAPVRIVLPLTAQGAQGSYLLPCEAGDCPFTESITAQDTQTWRIGLGLSTPGKGRRKPAQVVTQATLLVPTAERAELYQGSEAPLPGPNAGAFVERMALRVEAMVGGEGL